MHTTPPRRGAGRLALAALAGLIFLTACRGGSDWVQFRGEQGSGATRRGIQPPLAVRWKLDLQAEGQTAEVFNNPVVKDDTIYFGSWDGNFYALDILTGYMRWYFKTRGAINSVPFADEQKVYFGSNDGTAYALWRESGELAWSFDTGHTIQSTFVGWGENIVFISDAGSGYVLTKEGAVAHQFPNQVWVNVSFQVHEHVLYFAPGPPDRGVTLGVYDLLSRSFLFLIEDTDASERWYSFPALRGGGLYYATARTDGGAGWLFNYYARDRLTGDMLWEYTDFAAWGMYPPDGSGDLWDHKLQLLDYLAPALWRNLVIYLPGDAEARAFNARTGAVAWVRPLDHPATTAPAVAGNAVYFGVTGSAERPPRLVALSARSGRTLWEMETEGEILSSPLIAGRYMIFGTDQHVFYVIERVL